MKYLAEGLKNLTNLEYNDLIYNNLGDNENNMKYLAKGLSNLTNLQK